MASTILFISSFLSRFISNLLEHNTPILYTIQHNGEQLIQYGRYEMAYRLFVGLHDLIAQRFEPRRSQQQQQQQQQLCLRYQVKCLIHLNKYQQALDLCNLIAKSHPSSTGHLLAADIYIRQHRFDLALIMVQRSSSPLLPENFVSQGMDVFLQERILYEGIQQGQRQEIMSLYEATTCAPSFFHRVDLVQKLPYDLVCTIFLQLPLNDFLNCTKVNRDWRFLIISNPLFWQHLTFYNNPRPLPNHIVDLYLSRLHGAPLLSLSIHNGYDAETLLATICKSNCSQLYELEFTSLQCASKRCWDLFRQIIFSARKTLRILRLGSSNFKLGEIINLVSETRVRLDVLDLNNCFASMGGVHLPSAVQYDDNDSLQRLEHFGGLFTENYMAHLYSLPPLPFRRLQLSGIHGLTAIHLASILLRCPHLTDLMLENCLVNVIPVINVLRYSCPRLEQLHYHRNIFCQQPITEPSFYPIAYSSPRSQRRWRRSHSLFGTTVAPASLDRNSLDDINRQWQNDHQDTPTTFPYNITVPYNTYRSDKDRSFWKQLSLKKTRSLTDDLLHFILMGSYHTLERLDLKGNTQLSDNCIYNMIHWPQTDKKTMDYALPNLKECSFANCLNITELGLCLFFEHTPQLERLDLSGLSGVTDIILLSLALYCPRLSHLRLCHCRSITDSGMRYFIDAVRPIDDKKTIQARRLLQEVDLAKTNISMDCLAYVMCHIQQNGI